MRGRPVGCGEYAGDTLTNPLNCAHIWWWRWWRWVCSQTSQPLPPIAMTVFACSLVKVPNVTFWFWAVLCMCCTVLNLYHMWLCIACSSQKSGYMLRNSEENVRNRIKWVSCVVVRLERSQNEMNSDKGARRRKKTKRIDLQYPGFARGHPPYY